MARIIGGTIGRIVQVLWHDGTDFRVPQCDSDGHLLSHDQDLQTLVRYKQIRRWYDCWASSKSGNASSGNILLEMSVVPANRLLVVTSFICYISTGSATRIILASCIDSVLYILNMTTAVSTYTPLLFHGIQVLDTGDYLAAELVSVGSGTSFYAHATGYLVEKF